MRKINILLAPLVATAFLGSCTIKVTTSYGVFVSEGSAGVSISKETATKGKDFSAELAIKPEILALGDVTLPKTLMKVESGNRELLVGEYTYTLKENDTKADFAIPGKYIEGITNIYIDLIYHEVDSNEFAEAIGFEGNFYTQASMSLVGNLPFSNGYGIEGKFDVVDEFSPTVFHEMTIIETTEFGKNGEDEFVTKTGDDEYKKCSRTKEGDDDWDEWSKWESSDESDFYTPATTYGDMIPTYLAQYQLDFASLKYDSASKTYSPIAPITNVEIKLAFENRMLVDFVIKDDTAMNIDMTIAFTYNPVTPDLPKPITRVN